MIKIIGIKKEFAAEFEHKLILENSQRFLILLGAVILSQIVLIALEATGVMQWQKMIFMARLLTMGSCFVFVGIIYFFRKNASQQRSLQSLKIVTSIMQLLSILIGCYFVIYMFNTGIYSFSSFLLVGLIVSLTYMRNPNFSGLILLLFYAGLVTYLNFFQYPISLWLGEFLISFVFLFIIHIGNILNYNRYVTSYMQDREIRILNDQEIRIMNEKLKEMSQTDELTGIYNRRKISEMIGEYTELSKRYRTPFSLIMFDIDHFKSVNDSYGHNVGDAVLRQLADHVKSRLRSTDIFGRWGGEEFIILIPNDTGNGAYTLIESLRKHTETLDFPIAGKVTFSAGICVYKDGDSDIELIKKADDALYKAKESGRNQTQIYYFEDV